MSFLYTFLALAVLDGIWLFSMGAKYKVWLGHLFAESVSVPPILLFYPIYAAAVAYFVVLPGVKSGSGLFAVFLSGALLGLAAYATYDLTNQATLRNWPVLVTVVDMVWGAVLTGLASVSAVWLTNYFK